MPFRAERAVAEDGSVDWVVVDVDSHELHVESTTFLAGRQLHQGEIATVRGRGCGGGGS
ncbi:hypothetical protein [Saccharothrix deserti]|uniref:hypothetical protein n=1 Tax=Saccharothrix deserti TaxID=2593674 RepID=UPI00131E2BFA|nr:hypothetical protein [Saccharothrix deserti]